MVAFPAMTNEQLEDGRPPTDGSTWFFRRTVPFTLLAAVVGAGAAYARLSGGLVFGIQGMVAGCLVGAIQGRIGSDDPLVDWSPGRRLWLTVWCTLVFGCVHLAVLSWLHDPVQPLQWLVDVIDGSGGEVFYGTRRHGPAVTGRVDSLWWVVFQLTDLGLFAFLAFVGHIIGFTERKSPGSDDPGLERP